MERARRRRALAVILLGAVICAGCAPGADSWPAPKVVSVQGGESWYTLSVQYGLIFGPAKEGGAAPLLMEDGYLLVGKDSQPFAYRAADGTSLAVSVEAFRTTLAGKTVSIVLTSDEAWAWIEKAAPADLASLRAIDVQQELTPERLALMQKVAGQCPRAGLTLGNLAALRQVLPLFQPEWVALGNEALEEADYALLAGRKGLRLLMLNSPRREDFAALVGLKDLRTLFLGEWNAAMTGPLPAGLTNLKSVVALGAKELTDLSPFAEAGGLETLNVGMTATLGDLRGVAKLPHLRALNLFACEGVTDLAPLAELKELRWLGLPSKISQDEFAKVIAAHPNLAILEAIGCEGITDLGPVRSLGHLTGLAAFTAAPVEPLYEMKGLKWLAYGAGKDVAEDQTADRLAKLQAALPATAIARVAPLCLGSGWILALVPALGLGWMLALRRRGAAAKADRRHG